MGFKLIFGPICIALVFHHVKNLVAYFHNMRGFLLKVFESEGFGDVGPVDFPLVPFVEEHTLS